MTALIQCKCPANTQAAQFQEKTYGPSTRVANATAKGDKDQVDVRCTICGQVQRINRSRLK